MTCMPERWSRRRPATQQRLACTARPKGGNRGFFSDEGTLAQLPVPCRLILRQDVGALFLLGMRHALGGVVLGSLQLLAHITDEEDVRLYQNRRTTVAWPCGMTKSFASTCRLRTSSSTMPGAEEGTAKVNFAFVSQLRSLLAQRSPIISSTLTFSRRFEKRIPAQSMVTLQFSFEQTWPRLSQICDNSPNFNSTRWAWNATWNQIPLSTHKLARHNRATLRNSCLSEGLRRMWSDRASLNTSRASGELPADTQPHGTMGFPKAERAHDKHEIGR